MTINGRDMGTFIVQYGTSAERIALVGGNIQPLTEFHETDTGTEYKWFGSWVNKSNLPVVISEPSIQGAVVITVGTGPIAAGRQLFINCSIAGTVTVTFTDTSTLVVPVNPGVNIFPFAVTGVVSATATATYANLK